MLLCCRVWSLLTATHQSLGPFLGKKKERHKHCLESQHRRRVGEIAELFLWEACTTNCTITTLTMTATRATVGAKSITTSTATKAASAATAVTTTKNSKKKHQSRNNNHPSKVNSRSNLHQYNFGNDHHHRHHHHHHHQFTSVRPASFKSMIFFLLIFW